MTLVLSRIVLKRVMKHFAEMEMLRRRSEKNLRAYSAREKMQEKEDHDKVRMYDNLTKIKQTILTYPIH